MRKLLMTTLGVAALATASMASAAVTVTGSTGLNNPDPAAAGSVQTVGTTTTINFGANPAASPTFTGSFNFTNTVAGIYSIILGTSDSGVNFTSASIAGPSGTFNLSPFPDNTNLKLFPTNLLAGNYTFNFAGNNATPGGSLTGNVTITPAVPEAGTWGMMLLGFGATGLVIRRRRQPAIAQLA